MDSIALVKLALGVITERLILIMSVVMNFVLAIWVMQGRDLIQLSTLLVFVVFTYLINRSSRDKHETT